MIRALISAAALAPLLAGCVIYARDGGERVSVDLGPDRPPAARDAEPVRGIGFDAQGLTATVESNGCTDATDFEVIISNEAPADLTLRRLAPDPCRAIMPEGVVVRWSYAELGLNPGQEVRLINPVRLP